MSLGAIDFGLIVDGAVIIVESIVHRLQVNFGGQKLTASQMNHEVRNYNPYRLYPDFGVSWY